MEILRGSRVVARVDETKRPVTWEWVEPELASMEFRTIVAQETLEEMTGGRANDGDLYTQAFTVKRGTQAWLNRILETLWVWGLEERRK